MCFFVKRCKFFVFCFFLVFVLFNFCFAVSPRVVIEESTSVKELLVGKFRVESSGVVHVYNPSNRTVFKEFVVRFDLDSLVGVEMSSVDASSSKFKFLNNKIYGYMLQPNSTYSFGYRIYGLLDDNSLYEELVNSTNSSVFEYFSDGFNVLTDVGINLQKVEREGYSYDQRGEEVVVPVENKTNRPISYGFVNPSEEFSLLVKGVRVYRTVGRLTNESESVFFGEGDLIFSSDDEVLLSPLESKFFDFRDYESVDNSIYWLSSDVVIGGIVYNRSVSFSFFKEESGSGSSGGGVGGSSGGSSSSGGGGGGSSSVGGRDASFVVKKTVLDNVVAFNESVLVRVDVINVNDFSVVVDVFDYLPEGYDVFNFSFGEVSDLVVEVENVSLDGYESFVFSYEICNRDKFRSVTYLKPAELFFFNESFFSQGVLLINEFLDEKKIYLQKEVESYNEDFDKITLKVKNLGNSVVYDFLVSEEFEEDVLVKQISKPFYEFAVWRVSELKPNQEWEVSFLISKESLVRERIPNVFGIDSDLIYKTLIYKEKVGDFYEEQSVLVEKFGLFVAVLLLILYLLF